MLKQKQRWAKTPLLQDFNIPPLPFMKKKPKKKKVALPRRQWQINPVTRVKKSARKYSRPRAKQNLRKRLENE